MQIRWRLLLVTSSVIVALTLPLWLLSGAEASLGWATASTSTPASQTRLAEARDGDPSSTGRIYLPLIARKYKESPVFGVQMLSVSDANGLQQALDTGVSRVRTHTFRWDQIEPVRTVPPTYRWGAVNEASLVAAAENGIDVLAIVQFTPGWAQKVEDTPCGPIALEHLDEFGEFLSALAARYGNPPFSVRDFELGNEPDVDPDLVNPDSFFGCWGDADDPYYGGGYYAEMLKVAYPAIKSANPGARVYVGGLLLDCNPDNPPDGKDCSTALFLEGILRNGGGPYFDALSFHAYADYKGSYGGMTNWGWPGSKTAVPSKVEFLRSVLGAYGYGKKPLVNTEAALLCHNGNDETCVDTQAIYVARAYAEAVALGLEGQYYYQLVRNGWGNTGLVLPDLTPTRVYDAYVTALSFLNVARYLGPVSAYPAGIEGYSFVRISGDTRFDVVWSADGSPRSVTLPAGTSAYDRYGSLVGVGVTIQVDISPVYIVTP